MEGNKEGAKTCNLITDFSDKDMSTNPKDEVDPITIMLYTLHQSLSEEEIKTLSAVADVPRDVRYSCSPNHSPNFSQPFPKTSHHYS